jgi:hypothetical protein
VRKTKKEEIYTVKIEKKKVNFKAVKKGQKIHKTALSKKGG